MTPAEYARVKQVFSAAVELPERQRDEFVRQSCANTPELVSSVMSLLSHHNEETILAADHDTLARSPATLAVADIDEADSYLVNREIWEENCQILRRRLKVVAVVMSVVIAFSLLHLFTPRYAAVGYGARLVALGISGACAWLLCRKRDLTLTQLRVAEFVVIANVGMLAAAIYVRMMLDLAEEGVVNDAPLVGINNWNYFVWMLIIFIYGVFMPNTWQRAAAVMLPLATMPTLITLMANWIDPDVFNILEIDDFGMPIPRPFMAAGISIYAAHLIHGARRSALQARQLAQYRLRRLIGEGGMGQVFEAEHMMLKRACAIKLIRPEQCADDHALKRFEREVRATAQLTHPHTIEVYDYGQNNKGVFYFAMELLPGMNLKQLVQVAGPLPPPRVVHFLTQVCAALQEAHAAGMIHRDIKPANVFASQRGGIYDFTKLLDFGLVREISVDPQATLAGGLIAGSPGYMSPEQIVTPSQVDARSDLYSVAALGFHLLTGQAPFVADSAVQAMISQSRDDAPAPSTLRPDIPADLENIIVRCLAQNPQLRIGSAAQLRAALQDCQCAGQWTEQLAEQWWTQYQKLN